jgi:TctA family transporter
VTATGDPIPAILFGVPGGAGSAATVLDGVPLARRGEAGRALSAAYMSSLLGGLFGAAILALSIPVFRPMMRYIQSPELLAFSVFGLSMVAALAGRSPLRGLTAACVGLMIAMIGADPKTGEMRWTLDSLYLYDGLPLLPMILGLFALPELCDLAISRQSISAKSQYDAKAGMWKGTVDTFRNWWLVIRCGAIGSLLGAIPGVGGAVIDWVAYAHARSTVKGAEETFGTGDIRGVIASESANNAREGGALVPTIAFGVPGTATMALLISAFLVHGLQPGPDMLDKNLGITYSMIWSVAIANILGAGLCYAFSGQFARLATLRYTLIMPPVLCIIFIGAFEGSRTWGDFHTLLLFGVIGWVMKQLRWPRPPLLLGFVLGDLFERYLFISIDRYGSDWMMRPLVVVLFGMAFLALARPAIKSLRKPGAVQQMAAGLEHPRFRPSMLFGLAVLAAVVVMLVDALRWDALAATVPITVGVLALLFGSGALISQAMRKPEDEEGGLHMELVAETAHLRNRTIAMRAGIFALWLLAILAGLATLGLFVTNAIFVVAYMRLEARERWSLVLAMAACTTAFLYLVFERLLHIPWPQTLLGSLAPALQVIPGV